MFIVGCHRSGTSMLAGIARQLVQDLSDRPALEEGLVGGNAENPGGFFESEMLVETNNYLLELLNASWDRPFLAKPVWKNPSLLEVLVPLREKFRCYWQEPWIDKDPRLCLLWDAYRHILLRQPTGVAVIRNPLLVASSLELRNGFSPTKSAIIWWLYHYHLLNASEPRRLLTICDAALLQGEPGCIASVTHFLDEHAFHDANISHAHLQARLEAALRERYQPNYRRAQPLVPPPNSLLEQIFHIWQRWQESGCHDDVLREGFASMPAQILEVYEEEIGQGLRDTYAPMTQAFAQRCEITQKQITALSSLQGEMESCWSTNQALQQELACDRQRLESECEHLRGEMASIKRSDSWRITRPLRWLKKRMGSFKTKLDTQP
jgi:hypothetical protein